MKKYKIDYKGYEYEITEDEYNELINAAKLLEKAKNIDYSQIPADELVDISAINFDNDSDMPPFLKIAKYINKVKNPYYYKVGDVKVRTSYADTERTLADELIDMIKRY